VSGRQSIRVAVIDFDLEPAGAMLDEHSKRANGWVEELTPERARVDRVRLFHHPKRFIGRCRLPRHHPKERRATPLDISGKPERITSRARRDRRQLDELSEHSIRTHGRD
jgi:hypothetical protein